MSDDPTGGAPRDTEARLAALEREVYALRHEVAWLRGVASMPAVPPAGGPMPPPAADASSRAAASPAGPSPDEPRAPAASAQRATTSPAIDVEAWVSRLGVVLLVLGVGFFFRYAIEQGWIGEAVRVGLGGLLGGLLYAAAFRTHGTRPLFAQTLAGGGAAVWAVSIWASSVLYGFTAPTVASALLAASFVWIVALAVRWSSGPLAALGLFGAFVIPFVVPREPADPLAFVAWYAVCAGGVATLHLARAWKSPFWLGAGATQLYVFGMVLDDHGAGPGVWLLLGLAVTLAFGVAPGIAAARRGEVDPVGAGLYVPLAWLIGLACATTVWEHDGIATALGGAIGVAANAAFALAARRREDRVLATGHGLALLICTWLPVGFIAEDPNHALALLALLSLAWLAVAWRRADLRGFAVTPITVQLLVGAAIAFVQHEDDPGTSTALAWLSAAALVAAAGVLARLHQGPTRTPLALLAHVGAMGWFVGAGERFTDGPAAASVGWALLAVVQLVAGLRTRTDGLRHLGLLTLAALVAKLMLVDLQQVPLGLRIALFGGLGGALIGVGWLLPRLTGTAGGDDEPATSSPPPPAATPDEAPPPEA